MNYFLIIYLQFFSHVDDGHDLGWLPSSCFLKSLHFEIIWFEMKIPSKSLFLKHISVNLFILFIHFYSIIYTELMFSIRACDIWRRHIGQYSLVRCTEYKIGRISKSKRNASYLTLITKWIWDASVISFPPLVEERQLLCTSCFI